MNCTRPGLTVTAKNRIAYNRTRAEQRPPLLPNQVSADLLARVLPSARRPRLTQPRQAQAQVQAQPKARTEQPVRRKPAAARSSAPDAAKYTPQNSPPNGANGRPLNGNPLNGKSPNGQQPHGGAPVRPIPSTTSNGSPKQGSASRPTSIPPSQPRNGTPNSGQPSTVQREEQKPSRPVQMPLEPPAKAPADLTRRDGTQSPKSPPCGLAGYLSGARTVPSEPAKPSVSQSHFERSRSSSIQVTFPSSGKAAPRRS